MGKTLSKPFRIGTTGWTAGDLDNPAIERKWFRGRYEIINGVLTKMPPALLGGSEALTNLIVAVSAHTKPRRLGNFSVEADIVIDEQRVVRGDSCFLTPADKKRQATAARNQGKTDPMRSRVYVPPTIIVESMSPGHRAHDRVTKFAWYAEFGVKHFWILDAFRRTLDAFVLERGKYKHAAKLQGYGEFQPKAFPGLSISLKDVWPQ